MTDITIPNVGESVSEVTIAQWFKQVGDAVKKDEPLVELETDKAAQELVAPEDGTLEEILVAEGCLLYTSPSPRDLSTSRMPSSA